MLVEVTTTKVDIVRDGRLARRMGEWRTNRGKLRQEMEAEALGDMQLAT